MAAGGLMLAGVPVPAAGAVAEEAGSAAAVAAIAATAPSAASATWSHVLMNTLSGCELAVSLYPTFSYDASGGGGSGSVRQGDDGLLHLTFDVATLNIPPINSQHASIIGIPVPPPLNIAIVPQRLEGTLDPATGQLDLEFLASFEFTAGSLYRAAPLTVATTLTTEASQGDQLSGTGHRLAADGRARLAGVARVPATEDRLLNSFLLLPSEALAVLSADLTFS
ncbi:hypothetical protein D9Q98_001595 [Chlorella vulgaris]|uniref:Uncharacterized protein n=1 Tax=Chlorella vulgaris TaxID=3077 RepID=A0A9D4TUV8_CHLVU|nr:hypothetical protein D9Q98_001595 [Chlorella vulgaris]